VPSDARSVLTIKLGALRANWARMNREARDAECAAVVKADGYGLGLEQLATALRAEGCRTFFVATLDEGRRLRMVDPATTIYILDGLLPGAAPHYAGFDLRPCLGSLGEIEEWAMFCKISGRKLHAAIHVDTGMNRLGLDMSEVPSLTAKPGPLDQFTLALLMSHLACGDSQAHPLNALQRERFEAVRKLFPGVPASLSNSAGVFLGPGFHYDLVRPGIGLYGGRAFDGKPNPFDWVVKLEARILNVRNVSKGASVGYGASFMAERDMRVATIAVGYADGFLRALSSRPNEAQTLGHIAGHAVPVVGRVSMDVAAVDVTDVPPIEAQRGGWVEVLGARTTIDDLTDRAGTIGYELLTRLGRRVLRVYTEAA
jgi:alanine racemase